MFVSVGDGCIIGGLHKGLKDLYALGWIDRMPRLIGVQASGSAALHDAWRDGKNPMAMQPIEAHTIADSISAGCRATVSRRWPRCAKPEAPSSPSPTRRSWRPSGAGAGVGVFAEPAGAAGPCRSRQGRRPGVGCSR